MLANDAEKLALDVIGDGHRFSDKIIYRVKRAHNGDFHTHFA